MGLCIYTLGSRGRVVLFDFGVDPVLFFFCAASFTNMNCDDDTLDGSNRTNAMGTSTPRHTRKTPIPQIEPK